MPLFYLHTERQGLLIEDPDGSDLPDAQAAREEALAAARDLWASAIVSGTDRTDDRFIIANEGGEHVLAVRFIDALPEGLRNRLCCG